MCVVVVVKSFFPRELAASGENRYIPIWNCFGLLTPGDTMRRQVEYIKYGPDCVDPDVVRRRAFRMLVVEAALILAIVVLGVMTVIRYT